MEYTQTPNKLQSKHKLQSKLKEAFTLIELMIAITIIGLVLGSAFYGFTTYQQYARTESTRSMLRNIKTLISLYNNDTGQYPTRLQDLIKDPGVEDWRGPYGDKKQTPKDAWGKPFIYQQTPEDEHPYQLSSYGGPKGKQEPKNRRLSVWNV